MLRLTIILLLLTATSGFSQTKITWGTLSDVRFTRKYFEEVDEFLFYPDFGSSVKALNGKEVYLKGYMLAVDPQNGVYILSRNPFASCFFCGNSGPESIVELKLEPGHPDFEMDQVVTFKGRLKLNQDDVNQCNYILEKAEVYEVSE